MDTSAIAGFHVRALSAEPFELIRHSRRSRGGERLRYAIEIFVDCFSPAIRRQLFPAVNDLQEILGNVNDHFVTAQFISTLSAGTRTCLPRGSKRYRAVLDRLVTEHQDQMSAGRRKFLQ